MHEKITCNVLSSLPDLIIVSYETSQKQIFEGALLKISNTSPFEGFYDRLKEDNPKDYLEENFFSTVSKRHTYFQKENKGNDPNNPGSRGIQQPLRKLGVRLRARQVLCNRCKNVCTENGETVQPKRNITEVSKRQPQQQQQKEPTIVTKQKGKSVKNSSKSPPVVENLKFGGLVPKIRRLDPVEIEKFSPPRVPSISGFPTKHFEHKPEVISLSPDRGYDCSNEQLRQQQQPLKIRFANFMKIKPGSSSSSPSDQNLNKESSQNDVSPDFAKVKESATKLNTAGECSTKSQIEQKGRNLRKKRSAVGSMEDLWDETVFEEPSSSEPSTSNFLEPAPPPPLPHPSDKEGLGVKRSTPVLKISFGTLGQGTVLKIPSKLNGPVVQDSEENDENLCSSGVSPSVERSPSSIWPNRSPRYVPKESSAMAKAAKKALKRARKEAQRRAIHGGVSPGAYHIRNSPGTSFSPSSFGNSSPMMGLAALSPARAAPLYIGGGSVSPAYPFPSQSEAVMGPPAPTKVKKHKKKKHKKKKPDPELEIPNGGEEVLPSQFVNPEESEDVSDPLLITKSFEWKDISPGTVIWGKTSRDIWWPAKVTRMIHTNEIPIQVEVIWYSSDADEETSTSILSFEQVRSFNDFFQDCFRESSTDSSFETAVRLASEDNNFVQIRSESATTSENNSVFSPENSPRTIDCLS